MSARRAVAGTLVRVPAWDRSGCQERVCYCHDETGHPFSCSSCGCRASATKKRTIRRPPRVERVHESWDIFMIGKNVYARKRLLVMRLQAKRRRGWRPDLSDFKLLRGVTK